MLIRILSLSILSLLLTLFMGGCDWFLTGQDAVNSVVNANLNPAHGEEGHVHEDGDEHDHGHDHEGHVHEAPHAASENVADEVETEVKIQGGIEVEVPVQAPAEDKKTTEEEVVVEDSEEEMGFAEDDADEDDEFGLEEEFDLSNLPNSNPFADRQKDAWKADEEIFLGQEKLEDIASRLKKAPSFKAEPVSSFEQVGNNTFPRN